MSGSDKNGAYLHRSQSFHANAVFIHSHGTRFHSGGTNISALLRVSRVLYSDATDLAPTENPAEQIDCLSRSIADNNVLRLGHRGPGSVQISRQRTARTFNTSGIRIVKHRVRRGSERTPHC